MLPGLQPDEQKIYDVKYASEPIGKMDAIKLTVAVRALLIQIHVITGWTFPADKEFQDVLRNQFGKKLIEAYPNLNCDEIEYAFRNYPAKDWGKNINLNLIDEVIQPYLTKRWELSQLEDALSKPKELPGIIEEMTDEDLIVTSRFTYMSTKKYGLISPDCYDILVREGKINLSKEEKKGIKRIATTLFFSLDNKENINGLTHEQQERYIMMDCKRLAVVDYWTKRV